jgi:hypothetical protein
MLRLQIHIADVQKSFPRRGEVSRRETALLAWLTHLPRLGRPSDHL